MKTYPVPEAGKNAGSYGFSPQASADINVAALQAALDGGGIITIGKPGVYDLNNTVFLDSNTKLICAPGVIFRKVAPYCNVLINRGALTKEYNENITIDGLEISVNGQEAMPTLVYGLRAQLGFFYVKNLTIRNFTCADGKERQYLLYIVTWSNLLIENVRLAGDKDGIKLNNGHDAIIRNLDLTTYDDGLSLCGTDYPSTLLEVGDVYNVCYSNVTDHQYKNIFGRTCLIYTGSWADYKKGNRYDSGDFCLNQGKLYQVINDPCFSAVSSTAPVQESGIVTSADKISWRFIQPCDFYQTNVYNVTFDNCIFEKSGNIVASWIVPVWMWKEYGGGPHRPFYPGTEGNSGSWGISVNNCRITGKNPQVLVNLMGNMKDVTINGCFFNNPRCTVINVDQDSVNQELIASINCCTFLETDSPPATVSDGGKDALPDHQNCPILRRDIEEAGKLVVVHNGGKVHCVASGNSYRGSGFECSVSNNSQLRFRSMDMPLKDLKILKPLIGDVCRGLDGLYLYTSSGWENLSGCFQLPLRGVK
ncbi:MAG: hypothetical protein NTY10_02585 [Candidatus Omnitrophica bacterium]|nr:hypothetical protein [Candidatus Omnitrophota bacterium]